MADQSVPPPASGRFYETIVQSLGGIVWEADPRTFQFMFVSEQAERILGYPIREWLDDPDFWRRRTHPDDVAWCTAYCLDSARNGRDHTFEYRMIRKDGRIVWLRDVVTVRTDPDGTKRMLGVMLDISEVKRLEDQLRQAQKMEAVGQLAGGIAHDFNNLLTVIRGYVELLAENEQPREEHDIEEIRRACDRAVMLTQQLLAFSRKQVLHPQVLDLNAVVADIVTMLGRIIGETIVLTIDTSAPVPAILADRGQVQQVIVNIAVNARDAMPFGGTLTIRAATTEVAVPPSEDLTPGRYAVLSITDTGSGIPPEILPRIFEPFFTTKEPGKGTGLGLSTAYGIMKQSGGHLAVESTVDTGTTFTLYFPEASQAPAVEQAIRRPTASEGTESVLLVEDEAPVRELLVRALESKGYNVQMASHGLDALELCGRTRPPLDLLVTDVVMPGISGPELVRRLESIYSGLKVLYMSGYAGEAIQKHGITEFGITEFGVGFMQKPFTVAEFLSRVRDMLDARDEA